MTMSSDVAFTACKGTQARVKALYDELHSWVEVSKELKVSPAMAWRVANQGYEPKDPEIRKKLGFPEIIVREAYRDERGRFVRRGK